VKANSGPLRVIAYVRVSTEEQVASGGGLDAQRSAIEYEASQRGWTLVAIAEDAGASGRDLRRPGLQTALERIERGDASALAVSRLDRLSRSLVDFAGLMEQSRRKGWELIALDIGVDTTTPQGEMVANVLATFAQFERRLIGARTREGMAAKRAAGKLSGPIGRPRTLPEPVREAIFERRQVGLSYAAIAELLNQEGVPTAQGGSAWFPATVRKIVLSERSPVT
jgi:DNA invertase Pin-like site-specific DNA recombinase